MTAPSRAVGNGFSYQEKVPSSKLTSVLEAIAGDYGLVISGHSLVGAPRAARPRLPEAASLRAALPSRLVLVASEAPGP